MLMLQIMQYEATTSELAEILDVTRKTIALWSQQGIMAKRRHGVFDLKESLKNWAAYQKCIFEGAADPLLRWEVRRDIAYSEAQPLPRVDLENLRDIAELSTLAVELPEA
jgi:hypothetical protein